jgi:hypothetical protein
MQSQHVNVAHAQSCLIRRGVRPVCDEDKVIHHWSRHGVPLSTHHVSCRHGLLRAALIHRAWAQNLFSRRDQEGPARSDVEGPIPYLTRQMRYSKVDDEDIPQTWREEFRSSTAIFNWVLDKQLYQPQRLFIAELCKVTMSWKDYAPSGSVFSWKMRMPSWESRDSNLQHPE